MTIGRVFSAMGAAAALLAACGGDDDAEKAGNGVNDVRAACELRTKWNRTREDCGLCEAAVTSPRCECIELKAYSAACIDQAQGRQKACAAAVDACVFACRREDCNCIDACYATDACKEAAAARDGCITEACGSYCQ